MALRTHKVASADGGTVATFVPDAAMLCCSMTVDGVELLASGKGLEAYLARGSTMGIPLLYPWANRLAASGYSAAGSDVTLPDDRSRVPADPNGLPIHGVLPSLLHFDTDGTGDREGGSLSATLQWTDPTLLELFPFVHELSMTVSVGPGTLTVVTTVSASDRDNVPVSFGFHPYLQLPGTSRTDWTLELPPAEHLSLDEQMIPTGERTNARQGSVELADSSWDDGFALPGGPARYVAETEGHQIALEFVSGFPFSQIYAPPDKDFICFEPMTAPTNALRSGDGLTVLAPGESHRAEFRLSYST